MTVYFAFFSDFETNLNDRVIAAGTARYQGKPGLLGSDAEAACLEELLSAERTAWNLAVDYYAEIISPVEFFDREQSVPRLELAAIVADHEWDVLEERRLMTMASGFREVDVARRAAFRDVRPRP